MVNSKTFWEMYLGAFSRNEGSWDGSKLVLIEDFKYDDGSEEQRFGP